MADDMVLEILKKIQSDMSDFRSEVAVLKQEVASGFAETREEIETMSVQINGLAGLLVYHHGQHLRLEERVSTLEETLPAAE